MNLWYDPTATPEDLHRALATLGAEYPISAGRTDGATEVRFERASQADVLSVVTPSSIL
jgi:hypothetical protein